MSARDRFILTATTSYALLALVWIFLSDRLLSALVDMDAIVWLSTAKGVLFVLVSATMFFLSLRAVPPAAQQAGQGSMFGALAAAMAPGPQPRWLRYLFSAVVTLAMLVVRQHMSSDIADQPMLIVFMLPVILSAMLGGLGPGLLSTLIAMAGAQYLLGTLSPRSGHHDPAYNHLQMAFLLVNGMAVSGLSELLRRSLGRLEVQQHLLEAVMSGTPDAIFVKDLQGRYLLVNKAGAKFVGRPASEIIGRDDLSLFPDTSARTVMERDQEVFADPCTRTHEEHLTTHDGETRVFLVTKGPVFDQQRQIQGVFGISRDITERKRHELAQREAATVFESSYEGIMVVSPDRCVTKINPAFTRITGYSAAEIIGQSPTALASGRHGEPFYAEMWGSLQAHDFWSGEIWNRRKNGEIYPELLSISVVRDTAGVIEHYVGVFSDISRIKAHEAELDRIANYDPLTDLPNRRLLADRLGQALIRTHRNGKSLGVCFLDLDGFKAINDLHGHAVGDRLLVGVTAHLAQVLRADDTLARLGGDEFVLLLSDLASAEECTLVLDRVMAAVSEPVLIGDLSITISASLGVSLFPDDNVDADTLLRHADQAMYRAKDAGKNRYQLFDPVSDRKAQVHRRALAELRHALEAGEFVLHYQPKVDLASGAILGAEALIRWQHPERGLLSPAAFLPHIDGSDLEKPLGEWVIASALAQAEAWQHAGLAITVSVNISAHHLLQPDFHARLAQALARHPAVSPTRFELEVLETADIADMAQAVAVLQRCRALGVRFALDDFGTGYSSLTYLRKLPVDTLKIDQSFVRDMLTDPEDLGIVEGVIRLAGAFNRQVIAEGVETLEHVARLRALGCPFGQGYGIARPMPAGAFLDWAEGWQRSALADFGVAEQAVQAARL